MTALTILMGVLACGLCTLAAHVPLKPVHEKFHDNVANYGNPLSGTSQRELRQRAQVHVQNQQNRFNAEKFRQQKAMAQRSQTHGGETMDSYVKAYQEQQDGYQRELEKKQSKGLNGLSGGHNSQKNGSRSLKDFPNAQWWNSKQIRNKRVHNERDLVGAVYDFNNYGRLAQSGTQIIYSVNPNGFTPMAPPQTAKPNKYYSTPIQYNRYNTEVDSLSALIGKEPKDQLKGFNELLKISGVDQKVTYKDLSNSHVNIEGSVLDEPWIQDISKKYDNISPYASSAAAAYGYANQDSNLFLPQIKDHTPITEHVQDVPNTNKPASIASVTYYQAQATPTPATHASNYYKVEVANHVVQDHSNPGIQYLNKYESEHDNLHYAAEYEFGYRVKDHHTGNDFGHQEHSDGESAKGSYHVLLPDGRLQRVNYVAGPSGYHANVSYQ